MDTAALAALVVARISAKTILAAGENAIRFARVTAFYSSNGIQGVENLLQISTRMKIARIKSAMLVFGVVKLLVVQATAAVGTVASTYTTTVKVGQLGSVIGCFF